MSEQLKRNKSSDIAIGASVGTVLGTGDAIAAVGAVAGLSAAGIPFSPAVLGGVVGEDWATGLLVTATTSIVRIIEVGYWGDWPIRLCRSEKASSVVQTSLGGV